MQIYRHKANHITEINVYKSEIIFFFGVHQGFEAKHGCETWSLTMREEHQLRVSMNRVLRQMFGPKGEEVTQEWRMLHNRILHDLYPHQMLLIKSRRMRWAGHVECMRERR